MKKILLLLAIILFSSCSNDEITTQTIQDLRPKEGFVFSYIKVNDKKENGIIEWDSTKKTFSSISFYQSGYKTFEVGNNLDFFYADLNKVQTFGKFILVSDHKIILEYTQTSKPKVTLVYEN